MSNLNYWQREDILLRAVEPSDGITFQRWNEYSERGRHLDFLWPPSSRAAVEKWAAEKALQGMEDDRFMWVIASGDGEPVGSIDTHHCDRRNGTFSYGLAIGPEHQRQGYAGAAVQMILRYYFEELRYQKVNVVIHADNSPSVKLHEKLGFQLEGRQRRMFYTGGQFVDLLHYGLLKEEFESPDV